MHTESGAPPIGYRATPVADSAVMPAPISLHAVNGWRGPGALAIAFAHFAIATNVIAYDRLQPIALLVDLFFVLSGLLIAQAYTEKLNRASAIPEYVVRRFGRIWPVQAATLGVLVAYEVAKLGLQAMSDKHLSSEAFAPDGLNPVAAIWTNLLLLQSLGFHDRETWNFPSWSLSVEFATYVIFAGFCLLRPAARRTLSLAVILFSMTILLVVAPHHMRSTYDYGIFRCLAGFLAGSLLYDAVRGWRLPSWPLATLVEILAVAMVGAWMSLCVGTSLAFAAPIVFCLFILAFIQGRGLLSRVLLTKPFQVLAELSFTIYMVHALVIFALIIGLHVFERASGMSLFVTVTNPMAHGPNATISILDIQSVPAKLALTCGFIVGVLVAAYGAYRLVETPGRVFFGVLAKRLSAVRPRLPASSVQAGVDAGRHAI